MNVTELIERIIVTWLELEHNQQDQWHQTQQACDRTDNVEHSRQVHQTMYLRVYKDTYYSVREWLFWFLSHVSSKYWNYISTINQRSLYSQIIFTCYLFILLLS